jgi:hypothetical protein
VVSRHFGDLDAVLELLSGDLLRLRMAPLPTFLRRQSPDGCFHCVQSANPIERLFCNG